MDLQRLTADEPERFAKCFVQTAATKAGEQDEVTIEAYGAELAHLPIDAVEEAADRIRKMPQDFLPSAGYWFNLADEIAVAALAEQQPAPALPPPQTPSEVSELTDAQRAYDALDAEVREKWGVDLTKIAKRPTRVVTFHCIHCRDTGWIEISCTEEEQCIVCQRGTHSYDHTYVRRCACFLDNPELQRQRILAKARQPKRSSRERRS